MTEKDVTIGTRIYSDDHEMTGEIILQEISEGAGVMLDNGTTCIVSYCAMRPTNTVSPPGLDDLIAAAFSRYEDGDYDS